MLYDFELAGRRVRLWQRPGESYAHVLLKALGYAMYVGEFPRLEIERGVGLRYKPDLVAVDEGGPDGARRFSFWGECGMVTVRKVAWLVKHGGVDRLTLFKLGANVEPLAKELRAAVDPRRLAPGRLKVVNFLGDVAERAAARRIGRVPAEWYAETQV